MPSSSACYCSGLRFDSAASVNGTNSPRQPDAVRVTWSNQRTLKSAACTLHPGMPVTQRQREFGRLEEVIPQPDRIHVVRLITRRSSDGKLVSIPIDWASNVVDGQVLLTLDRDELDHLPEYVPPIPSAEARDRVQRALQEHPATAAAGIQVHDGTARSR